MAKAQSHRGCGESSGDTDGTWGWWVQAVRPREGSLSEPGQGVEGQHAAWLWATGV